MDKIIKLQKEKIIRKKYLNDFSNNFLENKNNKDFKYSKFNKTDISNNLKFEIENQNIFINKLYLNVDFREKKELRSNLISKINSYKQQDVKKKINENNLITIEELIEKLVISKLRCFYCKNNICLFYLNVREKMQWTLDRIDNNKNHSNDNTIISCLECNLKRRTKNKDHFLFTKQLKIVKEY